MDKKKKRFVKTFSEGNMNIFEIWVDSVTGVNYVFTKQGVAAGLTVLLDEEGKPVLTEIIDE